MAWLTWPLAAHIGSRLPNTHEACAFDTLFVAATLSHESRSLVTDPTTIADLGIYHPTDYTLFYGDGGFGALPIFMPVYLVTGNPAFAVNVTFLFGVIFTAFALHTVVHWWTNSETAGFFAAWTFLMNGWTLWDFLPTAPIYAILGFFPFIVFVASVPARSLRDAFRLLPLVVLQSLPSMVYLTGAVMGPLSMLGVWRGLRRGTRAAGVRLLVVLAASMACLVPIGIGYMIVRSTNPLLQKQTIWAAVMPTQIPWGLLGWMAPTAVPFGSLALIAIGAIAYLRTGDRDPALRRGWTSATFWALAGIFVSLTPTVNLFQRWWFTLPHGYLLSHIPAYQVGFFREPRRLGVGGLIGLAILTGLGVHQLLRWLRSVTTSRARWRALAAAVVLLIAGEMYAEYSAGSSADPRWRRPKESIYPTQAAIVPSERLLAALRRSTGPLLELPLATKPIKIWPEPHARAMYLAIFHRRPLVNGYSGYWPAGFQERMDVARTLPDDQALAALVAATDLETILVHTDTLSDADRARWLAEAERHDGPLRLVDRDGADLVFDVASASAAR